MQISRMRMVRLVMLLSVVWAVRGSAEFVVNGDFASGFFLSHNNTAFSGDTPSYVDSFNYDDGWVINGSGGTDAWSIHSGQIQRVSTNYQQFSSRGFGQYMSTGGTVSSGDTIQVAFDYDYAGGGNGLEFRLWGVIAVGAAGTNESWATFTTEHIELSLSESNDRIGSNYEIYNLMTFTNTAVTGGITAFASNHIAQRSYDLLAVAFMSDVDNNAGVIIDNVSVSSIPGAPIPTLSEWGMIIMFGFLILLGFRKMAGRQKAAVAGPTS